MCARVAKAVCVCMRECMCFTVCACVEGNHRLDFLNIIPCLRSSLSISSPFPSLSPPLFSSRFDMLNLPILFFFLLRRGSVLFKGLGFPPDWLNPTSVWIVVLFQTKDGGGITISIPFILYLSSGVAAKEFESPPLAWLGAFHFLEQNSLKY